jgi:putative metallohydrolase (TIGR04338 family)
MSRRGDYQQSKVYSAEDQMSQLIKTALRMDITTLEIGNSRIAVPVERKFADIASVQAYVDKVLARVARDYDTSERITVRARRGLAKAHYELGTIAIPPHRGSYDSWAMREFVVLHEIAHHLVGSEHHHDGVFVAALSDLLGRFVGPEAQFMFTVLSHENGADLG